MVIDAASISTVVAALPVERRALVDVLSRFAPDMLDAETECPAYTIKGIALHLLGDDLSLLSRQRYSTPSGLIAVAHELPGADFRTVLDTFNDRWVSAADYLSTDLVLTLLTLTGEWTAGYYAAVDPASPGEPVGLFGASGGSSPMWQSIAREFLERWTHHSQIRRAADLGSLADLPVLRLGVEIVAAIANTDFHAPDDPDGDWYVGPVKLGSAQQSADILTRAFGATHVRTLVDGPPAAADRLAAACVRP